MSSPLTRRPNFFLVGAPKCGTTALSEYLRTHPQVFMATPKEPHYFAADLPGLRYTQTMQDYERLFAHAKPVHMAIGDASPGYLCSHEAIANIRAYDADARLIVTLRNPVELVVSYHAQLLYSLYEDEPDLECAWRLQEVRRSGTHIPPHCREPAVLQYREILALGTHLQRLFSIFPRDQVLVIFHEDFRARPTDTYRSILQFLGLADDHRREFPTINAQKNARWQWMSVLLHNPPSWARDGMQRLAGTALHERIVALHGKLRSLNSKAATKLPLSVAFRQELLASFLPEIELLEQLLERDLNEWKRDPDDDVQPTTDHAA